MRRTILSLREMIIYWTRYYEALRVGKSDCPEINLCQIYTEANRPHSVRIPLVIIKFHSNRSFLRTDILWNGNLKGLSADNNNLNAFQTITFHTYPHKRGHLSFALTAHGSLVTHFIE